MPLQFCLTVTVNQEKSVVFLLEELLRKEEDVLDKAMNKDKMGEE